MEKKIIFLEETDSTNSYLRRYRHEGSENVVVAVAGYQTAGRGQGSNSWESERGKNLLFSLLIHPVDVPVQRQFVISMADALAQKAALEAYTGNISLKWPNDVYWKDSKISGTLIELSLKAAGIRDCIIGTGLNVNQQRFVGDAPNPVSLFQILGHEVDVKDLLERMLAHFDHYYSMVLAGDYEAIRDEYCRALYRRCGMHKYEDGRGQFLAETVTVEDNGHLVLRREDGSISRYAFKEVKFVLPTKEAPL